VSQYHKGKTNLEFTEARDSEWQYPSYTSYSTYVVSSVSLRKKKHKANEAHETINHFVCNFAKCSAILKILSPAK